MGLVHPPCHVLGCCVFFIFMWCLERFFVCLFGGWGVGGKKWLFEAGLIVSMLKHFE